MTKMMLTFRLTYFCSLRTGCPASSFPTLTSHTPSYKGWDDDDGDNDGEGDGDDDDDADDEV